MNSRSPSISEQKVELNQLTCFSLLPAELRLKIWYHTFEPRTLELHTISRHSTLVNDQGPWSSNCRNPATLSVCHESRQVALALYSVKLDLGDGGAHEIDRVLYLDPAVDTVLLLGDHSPDRIRYLFLKVAELAADGRSLRRVGMSIRPLLRIKYSWLFEVLEQVTLLLSDRHAPPAHFRGEEWVLQSDPTMDESIRTLFGYRKKLERRGEWWVVGDVEVRAMRMEFVHGTRVW